MRRSRTKDETEPRVISLVLKSYNSAGDLISTYEIPTSQKVKTSLRFSSMTDRSPGWGQMNPVSHTKVTYSGKSLDNDEYVFKKQLPWEGSYQLKFSARPCPSVATPPGPTGSQLHDFAWDALENATEQIPEEVSLANALIELREVGDLIITKWEGILKSGSKAFLSWQFGWKPMLSDIKKIVGVARAVQKRLKFLKETWGKPTTIHFAKPFSNSTYPEPSVPWDEPSTPWSGGMEGWALMGLQATTSVEQVKGTMSSTIVIYHELEGLDEAMAYAKALENALGLNNLPNTLWNAMPFSWMIEWFINVGHALKAIDVEPFKGKIQVLDACYSVKAEAEYGVYAGHPKMSSAGTLLNGRYNIDRIGRMTSESYMRARGIPVSSYIFLEDNYTLNQLAILLALLFANGKDE